LRQERIDRQLLHQVGLSIFCCTRSVSVPTV
jgi:hypothetical protein